MGQTSASYLSKLRRIKLFSAFCCFVGLALSIYAFWVEYQYERDNSYVAMCDINDHMSCTKAFASKYGKGFGLLQTVLPEDSPLIQPNSIYGITFYLVILTLGLGNYLFLAHLQTIFCCIANIGSIYLGYILYFILNDLCVVCFSIYGINLLLLIASFFRTSNLKKLGMETGGPIISSRHSKKRV